MLSDSVITLRLRFGISQTFGEQFTRTFYRMLLFSNVMFAIIKQASQRLAGRTPVHTMLDATCQTRHQRRTFNQTLRINYRVILLQTYRIAKRFTLGFNRR